MRSLLMETRWRQRKTPIKLQTFSQVYRETQEGCSLPRKVPWWWTWEKITPKLSDFKRTRRQAKCIVKFKFNFKVITKVGVDFYL